MSLVNFAVAVKKFFLHIRATRNTLSERMSREQPEQQADAPNVKKQAAQAGSVDEYVAYFDEQMSKKNAAAKKLQEENQKLREENESLRNENCSAGEKRPDGEFPGGEILSRQLIEKAGRELYQGEFADRARFAMRFCAQSKTGVDKRTKAVLENLLGRIKHTGEANKNKLKARIKNACKDHKKMPAAVGRFLDSFSFEKRGNKHTVFSPPEDLPGLERMVVAQSPSSLRSVKQQEFALIHMFGLHDI